MPKMGYEKLADGYRKIISRIYSPRLYYERVREFLREYRPREKRKWHFHLGYLRWHFSYLLAPDLIGVFQLVRKEGLRHAIGRPLTIILVTFRMPRSRDGIIRLD